MASVSQYIVVVSTIPTQLGRCNNVHCIVHSDIFYRATANGFNKPGSTETEHSLFTGCIKLLKVNYLLWYQYGRKDSQVYVRKRVCSIFSYTVLQIIYRKNAYSLRIQFNHCLKILMNLHFILCNGSIYM